MLARSLVAAPLLVLSLACSKGPTTPTDPASKASFTVDGQAFQPSSKGMSALDRGGSVTDVMAQDCATSTSVVISLQGPLTVGSVPMTRVLQAAFFSGGQWEYVRGQGRGSLTLTSASPRVAGTYEFDMPALAGTGAVGTKFVQGSFDVSYGNGTVCK